MTAVPAAEAQDLPALADPLRLVDVVAYARLHRSEIMAARSAAQAASFRRAIVSALPDPTLSTSIDHAPFSMGDFDRSMTWEQAFPPRRQRGYRDRAARAEADRLASLADRVSLDVEVEAARSFVMLYEARQMYEVATVQLALARQLVAATEARYAAGSGNQAEVLRAETEVARIGSEERALAAEIGAATAMFNGALGRAPGAPVPALAIEIDSGAPSGQGLPFERALELRPELAEARAEVARAMAEVDVMQSMYAPMWMVRGGPAYTMSDGAGLMFMVGVSVPIRRARLAAGVSEARSMVRMAESDLDAMRLMVAAEVVAANERVAAAQARLDGQRDAVVPRARQTFDAWLAAYGAGQSDLVTVVDAAQALWMAQEQQVRFEASLELERISLSRAVGSSIGMRR